MYVCVTTACPASFNIAIASGQWIIKGSSVNRTGSLGYCMHVYMYVCMYACMYVDNKFPTCFGGGQVKIQINEI